MSSRSAKDGKPVSFLRVVTTSFIAGVSAMAVAGFACAVAADGGFVLASAHAATLEHKAPLIAPLDVAAVRAQLAQADRDMKTAQDATNGTVARLQQLSR